MARKKSVKAQRAGHKRRIPTSEAHIERIQKGTKRTGQRIVPKGTEPCMVWVSDNGETIFRETEAHISFEPEIKISVPADSYINNLITRFDLYTFIATFVDGRSVPQCIVFIPVSQYKSGNQINYYCWTTPTPQESIMSSIDRYKEGVTAVGGSTTPTYG